jgi:hypothetical protein
VPEQDQVSHGPHHPCYVDQAASSRAAAGAVCLAAVPGIPRSGGGRANAFDKPDRHV